MQFGGVVYQDVDRAVLGQDFVLKAFQSVYVAEIDLLEGRVAGIAPNLCGNPFAFLQNIENDDVGAEVGQATRHLFTNAARRSRDDGHAAVEYVGLESQAREQLHVIPRLTAMRLTQGGADCQIVAIGQSTTSAGTIAAGHFRVPTDRVEV